ncbi:MAG: creatininase family protein [Cyanobacteria bacterium J06641_5]
MTALPRRYWAELTSAEFAQLDREKTIALLPVAAIEQHGPHLPVMVDACLLEGILARALELLPVEFPLLVLPTQAIGNSKEHACYPGTLTLSPETTMQLWLDIGASVAAAGLRKLVIFNSHGGQISLLDIVGRELRIRHNLLVVHASWFSFGYPDDLFEEREIRFGIHGGEIETSMMLHLAPELVQMDKARDFKSLTEKLRVRGFQRIGGGGGGKLAWQTQDLNVEGVCGNAQKADRDRGEALVNFAAERLIELLEEVDRLPLTILDNDPAW